MLLIILAATGCQTADPLPTPTATRTPVLPTPTLTPTPTQTPTRTPTATPTPTPTLPPGLLLSPTPAAPEGWPPLPAALYFLRSGRIWSWLAEGGNTASFPVAPEVIDQDVLGYRITPDQHYLAYVTYDTDSGQARLYRFDQAAWEHTLLPTSGRLLSPTPGGRRPLFEITPDGRYVLYLAWGVQPQAAEVLTTTQYPMPPAASSSATLLRLDAQQPRQRQQTLAFCEGGEAPGGEPALCQGFTLAPDGEKIALVDARGVWLVHLDGREPQLLAAHPEGAVLPGGAQEAANRYQVHSWDPESRWLLLEVAGAIQPTFVLLDTGDELWDAGQARGDAEVTAADLAAKRSQARHPLPALCSAPCQVNSSWGAAGMEGAGARLWLSWNTPNAGGCLLMLTPQEEGVLPVAEVCQVAGWQLAPTSLHAIRPGARPLMVAPSTTVTATVTATGELPTPEPRPAALAFLHQGSRAHQGGALLPEAGIYLLGAGAEPEDPTLAFPAPVLQPFALLPQSATSPTSEGRAYWTEDGSAFLYLDQEGHARYLGTLQSGTLWKVAEHLRDAYAFTWSAPASSP